MKRLGSRQYSGHWNANKGLLISSIIMLSLYDGASGNCVEGRFKRDLREGELHQGRLHGGRDKGKEGS